MNDAIAPASVMPSSSSWPLVGLAVREHQRRVDRLVLLAERRVDLELGEQRVHAERARLVGDDRHDARPELGILQQHAQQPRERHRRGRLHLLAGARGELVDDRRRAGTRSSSTARRDRAGSRRARAGAPSGTRTPATGSRGGSTAPSPLSSAASGISRYSRSRKPSARRRVIFLIWCVALRASKSAPSVQPFTVLARITVGAPSCSTAVLYAA